MIKLRKVKYTEHPVLGNLEIDFTDLNGKAADTILIAGENGVGKSTLLNSLYSFAANNGPIAQFEKYDFEYQGNIYSFEKTKINENSYNTRKFPEFSDSILPKGIYSKVDINFNSNSILSVTSKNVDQSTKSIVSSNNLPQEINQLIIDLQASDDGDLATAYREAQKNGLSVENLTSDNRMKRFKTAFSNIFENMEYLGIENIQNRKAILFKKFNQNVPIEMLSSGEKQIVYRGAFLLKDCNSLQGAFVFIDEPEISLHPEWQKKIMNYYCDIFRNSEGTQTSQIFAVTHSPFIIHNEKRTNDKVIVLTRNPITGIIEIKDKPEYYTWNNPVVIEDAFRIKDFNPSKGAVYLEGRTDEKYFNKAVEVFNYSDLPFEFKWIGYLDDNNQERNTGFKALEKAYEFLVSQTNICKYICLSDCDTNWSLQEKNNIYKTAIPQFHNSKNIKKGIENALILDDVDITPYYGEKRSEGDYGEINIIKEFKKMEFCDYICSLEKGKLEIIFGNLKKEIEKLIEIYN